MLTSNKKLIKVIDLFAGAGGLGEGFTSWTASDGSHPYDIVASVEKEKKACETLRMRAFYRKFNGKIPNEYYKHLNGDLTEFDLSRQFPEEWQSASIETLNLELGKKSDNRQLQERIKKWRAEFKGHWLLLGGPPCQAYSTAGRGRLSNVKGYSAETDPRSFLYKQYISVIRSLSPSVFVMENVKGLLSAKLDGKKILPQILKELASVGRGYRICSLSSDFIYSKGDKVSQADLKKFLVNSAEYGIPQNRQRVFLIGLREDLNIKHFNLKYSKTNEKPNVFDVLKDLPKIRSGLSKKDTDLLWQETILKNLSKLRQVCSKNKVIVAEINGISYEIAKQNGTLQPQSPRGQRPKFSRSPYPKLNRWFIDKNLRSTPNHISRSHMPSDLMRYLFCAVYAKAYGISPKAVDFPKELAPNHSSWLSGDFSDRFRVQIADTPSTTITSHIASDGHYFIHYDPLQCRTLSVREAARLQTFPDNYFFKGYRTHQYTQVGNAVPPLLANQIAGALWDSLQEII